MLRLSVNGSVITRGAAHPTTQMDAERLRGVLEFLDSSAGPEGRPEIQQELGELDALIRKQRETESWAETTALRLAQGAPQARDRRKLELPLMQQIYASLRKSHGDFALETLASLATIGWWHQHDGDFDKAVRGWCSMCSPSGGGGCCCPVDVYWNRHWRVRDDVRENIIISSHPCVRGWCCCCCTHRQVQLLRRALAGMVELRDPNVAVELIRKTTIAVRSMPARADTPPTLSDLSRA